MLMQFVQSARKQPVGQMCQCYYALHLACDIVTTNMTSALLDLQTYININRCRYIIQHRQTCPLKIRQGMNDAYLAHIGMSEQRAARPGSARTALHMSSTAEMQ